MPLSQRIHDQFLTSLQNAEAAPDVLAEPIGEAVQVLTASLMREGKILTCGQGASALLGRHLAGILAQQFEKNRPGLAAIALDADAVAWADDAEPGAGLARQIEALGHPGDILFAISTFGAGRALLPAVHAAHERDMRVVLLTGGEGGPLAEILGEADVVICVPAESAARVMETQLLAIHILCDGIDFFLLGA